MTREKMHLPVSWPEKSWTLTRGPVPSAKKPGKLARSLQWMRYYQGGDVMNPALWVAKTGLDAQQTRMTVVSNNLANVNTTGFEKDRAKFEHLIYQTVRQPGGLASQDNLLPSGLSLGTGVRVVATEKQHTQGNLIQTDNALDIAIQGRGFFQILMPDGTIGYSRDGAF